MVSTRDALRMLPPGPPLPPAAQAGLILVAPLHFLYACHRRYGDRFTIRIPGIGNVVYLTDRDDIKTVLRGDPAIFHAGEANAPIGEILGPKSVLVLDEDRHRRLRAMMTPAFHGDAVRRQVAEMVAIAADNIARWPVGEPFPLIPRMRALTLEVILRTVFGVSDEDRLAALRVALPAMVELGSPLKLLPPPRVLRNVGLWRRRAQRRARAQALLRDEIARCRRDPRLDTRTDTLALLLRSFDHSGVDNTGVDNTGVDDSGAPMPDDELVDQLITLLLAGHETTATALAWTFERLTRYPALLDRTRQAAAERDDVWLDAVCRESLRARPVVYEVARKVTEPVRLNGYTIPAGTMLAPYINQVHRDARYYPDPKEFRPQRFLDQRVDTAVWFPFGGGVRRCLGATFAQVEMRTVLREVLRRVELATTTAPDEQTRVRQVTLIPRHGAMVRVVRRIATAEPPAERTAAGGSEPSAINHDV